MTLAAINWLRAGADILGAFACAFVGQWWGYRKGRKEEREAADRARCGFVSPHGQGRCVLPYPHAGTHYAYPTTECPDRDSERLPGANDNVIHGRGKAPRRIKR